MAGMICEWDVLRAQHFHNPGFCFPLDLLKNVSPSLAQALSSSPSIANAHRALAHPALREQVEEECKPFWRRLEILPEHVLAIPAKQAKANLQQVALPTDLWSLSDKNEQHITVYCPYGLALWIKEELEDLTNRQTPLS